jgi:hypothetical protein
MLSRLQQFGSLWEMLSFLSGSSFAAIGNLAQASDTQIDEDKVGAKFRNGVLIVTVPRIAGADGGRKTIPINAR